MFRVRFGTGAALRAFAALRCNTLINSLLWLPMRIFRPVVVQSIRQRSRG